jgi:hypothetical protein
MSGMSITNKAEIKAQIERIKQKILDGAVDGMKDYAPHGEQVIQHYVQKEVYSKYDPEQSDEPHYHRTYKLMKNSTSFVKGTTLYIGTSANGMENANGKPYLFRVLEGNSVNPYEFQHPNSSGDYRPERDWIEPTEKEFLEDTKQEGVLHKDIVNSVNKRLGR